MTRSLLLMRSLESVVVVQQRFNIVLTEGGVEVPCVPTIQRQRQGSMSVTASADISHDAVIPSCTVGCRSSDSGPTAALHIAGVSYGTRMRMMSTFLVP